MWWWAWWACADPVGPAVPAGDTAPAAVETGATGGGPWRSALYPEDWAPGFADAAGRALPDFSFAGYHRSEVALPEAWPGGSVSVVDHGADPASEDNTAAFQAAIDAVAAMGGGEVFVPAGDWRLGGDLVVTASGTRIRGDGAAATRLWFSGPATSGQRLAFRGAPESTAGRVLLAADGVAGSATVTVIDGASFSVGDPVLLDQQITAAWIAEYAMTGLWDAGSNSALDAIQVMARREVVAVAGDTITLDIPLRAPLRVRDAAAIRPDPGALVEVGVQDLAIADATDPADALQWPRVHALGFDHVRDAFVMRVESFDPPGEPSDDHLRSGGLAVVGSSRVTVSRCVLAHAQHRGDGGAGYAFEASGSNEVLFADVTTADVRHGFIQNWGFGSSGLVWLRARAEGDRADNGPVSVPGRSEFHHRLAVASLFDSTYDDAGFAAYNRQEESSNAGHTAEGCVFWRVSGAGSASRLSSYQAGFGYVIGTDGLTALVVPDLLDAAIGADVGTAPVDWLEGVDRGGDLVPSSLFEDQLARRLAGRTP
jgi:hypothetical protein